MALLRLLRHNRAIQQTIVYIYGQETARLQLVRLQLALASSSKSQHAHCASEFTQAKITSFHKAQLTWRPPHTCTPAISPSNRRRARCSRRLGSPFDRIVVWRCVRLRLHIYIWRRVSGVASCIRSAGSLRRFGQSVQRPLSVGAHAYFTFSATSIRSLAYRTESNCTCRQVHLACRTSVATFCANTSRRTRRVDAMIMLSNGTSAVLIAVAAMMLVGTVTAGYTGQQHKSSATGMVWLTKRNKLRCTRCNSESTHLQTRLPTKSPGHHNQNDAANKTRARLLFQKDETIKCGHEMS